MKADKKNDMIKYIKRLLQLILQPSSLNQLKTKISMQAEKALSQLAKHGLSEEKKQNLINYFTNQQMPSLDAVTTWMSAFFDDILEKDFRKRKAFLYQHRWDIACLNEEEYSDFYDHLQVIEFEFIEGINDTIKCQFVEMQHSVGGVSPREHQQLMWIVPNKNVLPN